MKRKAKISDSILTTTSKLLYENREDNIFVTFRKLLIKRYSKSKEEKLEVDYEPSEENPKYMAIMVQNYQKVHQDALQKELDKLVDYFICKKIKLGHDEDEPDLYWEHLYLLHRNYDLNHILNINKSSDNPNDSKIDPEKCIIDNWSNKDKLYSKVNIFKRDRSREVMYFTITSDMENSKRQKDACAKAHTHIESSGSGQYSPIWVQDMFFSIFKSIKSIVQESISLPGIINSQESYEDKKIVLECIK